MIMRKALKRAIAYGIYYIIFIGVTIYGTIRGWPIQPERSSASVSFLASFLLLLPPGLYLIISVCIGLLT